MSKVTSYPADYQTFPTLFELEPVAGFEDADDTNADTYGAQQLTLLNAYYGEYCYMPLLLFEGRSGRCSLFFPPADVHQIEPVGGDGRGVRADWSGHNCKVSCYMYKCTYNI